MRTSTHLKDSIKKSIDALSAEKLLDLRRFLDSLENKNSKNMILSFAGSWSELGEAVMDEFTKDLEKRRGNSYLKALKTRVNDQ